MPTNYDALCTDLRAFLREGQLVRDPLRTLAYGTDASFYRLVPRLVVLVDSEQEVIDTLACCRRHKAPVTFRAAGTSLSGQAITDSVLIKLGTGWRSLRLLDNATRIALQPGVVGGHANRALAPFQKKIGPDPASINAAMIGGIAANNASGMCCGTAQNSYHTLAGMRVVFADGTVLDTGDERSRNSFLESHADLVSGVSTLADSVKGNPALAERIRHKYRLKNTTGYGLNALIDFDDPIEIIQHLMIGSEGTLGFISEITYHTVDDFPHKATDLVVFPDLDTACNAVSALKSTPVSAVELIDNVGLHAVAGKPGMPGFLAELDAQATALLIEVRGADSDKLAGHLAQVSTVLAGFPTLQPVHFRDDAATYTRLWNIRKGLFPAVGAVRAAGTTVIIEDVAFPVPRLSDGVRDLRAAFDRHGYTNAILFGHALEGNLHFVFTQDFEHASEVQRYSDLMDEVCDLIVKKYDGSLKAEHGTGRNMAPYVALEWGDDGYGVMQEIKRLFDPQGLLNPGVILNENRHIHLENLKPMPAASELIDTCIECGFCEVWCPSRDLTLTPRQRIVIWRELARLESTAESRAREERLRRDFDYLGVETCAADGLCSTSCPVGINTGDLTRAIRHQRSGRQEQRAHTVGTHFGTVLQGARVGLRAAQVAQSLVGNGTVQAITRFGRRLAPGTIPEWHAWMPTAATAPPTPAANPDAELTVVYVPSCATRTLGPALRDTDRRSLPEVIITVLERAGIRVVLPDNIENLCCGMAFHSKGLFAEAERKQAEFQAALLAASGQGRWPILMDTSPCHYHTQERAPETLTIFEPIRFISELLLPRVAVHPVPETVAVHLTCSSRKLGLESELSRLAARLADEVVVPPDVACCGFAGDKGFFVPELNASALTTLKPSLPAGCARGYSTSRTCEIGLSRHADRPYRSIFYLLDQAMRLAQAQPS